MSADPSGIARSRARAGAVVDRAALASFQLALALGAPWGAAALGGERTRVSSRTICVGRAARRRCTRVSSSSC
jgi:hypothetical protein